MVDIVHGKNLQTERFILGSFTHTVDVTGFVSGTFDLDVVCKQPHRTAVNPFLNGRENGDVGVCVNEALKRTNAKNATLKDAKSSFTLNESESDFVSLIFVGAQCEH